jgi:hypothetical protein
MEAAMAVHYSSPGGFRRLDARRVSADFPA